MSFELFVASRYLIGRRKGLFAFITTAIAIAGITLGVASLVITLAVMTGFHDEIQKRILGVQTHIIVGTTDPEKLTSSNYTDISSKIEKLKEIQAISPFAYGQIVIKKGKVTTGVVLKGIVYEKEKKVGNIEKYLFSGDWKNFTKGIVLGRILARMLNVVTGDKVLIISPDTLGTPFASIPRMKVLTVVGTFESGMYEYDANMAYVPIEVAQNILGLGNTITALGIKINNMNNAKAVSVKIGGILGESYWTQIWQDMNRNLFSALKLEKIMMFIILTLIVFVASFNIISNLLIFTIEKVRDIGILSALGATKRNIYKIFIYEGLIMGVIGILLGSSIGIAISLILKKYKFIKLPHDVYFLDTLPAKIVASDIIVIVMSAMVIIFLSTLYPAKKASETDPIEAIRYG